MGSCMHCLLPALSRLMHPSLEAKRCLLTNLMLALPAGIEGCFHTGHYDV